MDVAILGTAFGLVFIAELGDKTQLALLALSARSGRFWPTFLGGFGALAILALAAAAIGSLLGSFIPDTAVRIAAGALFILLGLWILYDVLQGDEEDEDFDAKATGGWLRLVATAFLTIGLAELGDKSQLAVATLASDRGTIVEPFIGATVALGAVTLISVGGGRFLARWLPPRRVQFVAALAFILAGILLLALG